MSLWVTTPDFAKAPGDAFGNYQIDTRGLGGGSADGVVDDLVAALKPVYNASATFQSAELWKYASGSQDGVFLSAYSVNEVGTAGGANIAAAETIFTFRTINGRLLKFTLEESVFAQGASVPIVIGGGGVGNTLAGFVMGNDWAGVDREGGLPIAAMRWFPGQNEAIFKRRYRPNS
jgi:hypothetical protein